MIREAATSDDVTGAHAELTKFYSTINSLQRGVVKSIHLTKEVR